MMRRRSFAGKSLGIGSTFGTNGAQARLAPIDTVAAAAQRAAFKADQDQVTAAGVERSLVEYANQAGAARKDRSAIMKIAHANARHIRKITPGTTWRVAMARGLRDAWAYVPQAIKEIAAVEAVRAATAARKAEREANEARAAEDRAAKRAERAAADRAARAAARADRPAVAA